MGKRRMAISAGLRNGFKSGFKSAKGVKKGAKKAPDREDPALIKSGG
jgi:hypothetical protein